MTSAWYPRGLRASFLAAAFGALLGIAGCGSGGDDAVPVTPVPPVPVSTGSVSGSVVESTTGVALSGVTVKAAGKTASTSADGSYTLTEVPAGDGKVVSFELAGHAKGLSTVSVPANGAARASARLTPVGVVQNFDAASAATVTISGSAAQVSVPAGGLATASGAAPSGMVRAELTAIDPAADPANMPGNYTAQTAAGGTGRIESFGALKVTFADAAGNALNLAAGKTATIRIALASRSASPPASVPLYYLNELTGLWMPDGSATLAGTAPNQYYEGTVTHFTYWNADQPTETITVTGCVQDANGVRIAGADVSTYGSDYSGTDSVVSNSNGQFVVAMRKGGIATLFAQLGARSSNSVRVGPSNTDIVLPACLVLSSAGTPPTIVVQPQPMTTLAGGFAFFRVEAIGSPSLQYQWRRNGVAIAGATGSVYPLFPATAADNGASFTVQVSNAYGSVTSDAAVLTVNSVAQPPLITGQPLPASVQPGATATFTVAALAQGGTLGYQWLRGGVAIAGATGSSYTTPPTVLADNGASFSVRVSSSNGTSTLSNAVLLTVAAPTPLVITNPPQNASVSVGQVASFSVSASGGSAPISYQWRRGGVAIAGATSVSYSTAATVLGDNGASFSVVVTSGTESVTSNAASLSVTAVVGANGYYLVAPAGPLVSGSVSFANGAQALQSQALLAVNTAAPNSPPVTVEPAGVAPAFFFASALQGTVANGQVSNLRSRIGVYAKGGRFYKLDQLVANGSVPTPQLVSSLGANEVCGTAGFPTQAFGVQGSDFANPLRSWVFYRAPGPDGLCNNADDTYRALRLDMAATDAALTVAEPVADILAADGSVTGFIVRQGTQMNKLDANLANPSDLFTISNSGFESLGVSFGSSAPGVWLFVDGGKLWGVQLSAPGTRVELATLGSGETASSALASDGGSAFIGISSGSGARLIRVTEALAVSHVATFAAPINDLVLTPTRLVVVTRSSSSGATAVLSLPKAGGTPLTLASAASGSSLGQVVAAGENVYATTTVTGATGSSVSTLVVGADGSNPVTLANTELRRGIGPATASLTFGLDSVYAVLLADNVTSPLSDAGVTLRVVDGATRNTLLTYGTVDSTVSGKLNYGSIDPLQYGQSGLLSAIVFSGSSYYTDLYYFKSDAAGLVRVTNYGTATPSRAGRAR